MSSLIEKQKNLKRFTSWLTGGTAEFYARPQSIEELKEVLVWSHQEDQPYTVLGGGTNVLISDKGVKGLVIHTEALNSIKLIDESNQWTVEALCGTPKSEILKLFLKQRLQPAIFLAGLPGDMAGGVVMNAGVGHKVAPKEFCEIVLGFDVLELTSSGEIVEKTFNKEDVEWVYRHSKGWQPGVITRVRVSWPNTPDQEVLKKVRAGNKRRKETQPLNLPSCGSVFKNPEGDHSGRLIEEAGLKGFSIGGAQVSEKHANFIVNTGSGTSEQIHQVILHVQKTIKEKYQISLTNEVVYLGKW